MWAVIMGSYRYPVLPRDLPNARAVEQGTQVSPSCSRATKGSSARASPSAASTSAAGSRTPACASCGRARTPLVSIALAPSFADSLASIPWAC